MLSVVLHKSHVCLIHTRKERNQPPRPVTRTRPGASWTSLPVTCSGDNQPELLAAASACVDHMFNPSWSHVLLVPCLSHHLPGLGHHLQVASQLCPHPCLPPTARASWSPHSLPHVSALTPPLAMRIGPHPSLWPAALSLSPCWFIYHALLQQHGLACFFLNRSSSFPLWTSG